MNAAEVFAQMSEAFLAERAGDLRATYQFNLSGEGGGDWTVVIADGACDVLEGKAEKPDVTIGMTADDYVKMAAGDLQPIVAFMQGKIKLQGDPNLAMRIQELFAR
jgi:putative sterol carrier protein